MYPLDPNDMNNKKMTRMGKRTIVIVFVGIVMIVALISVLKFIHFVQERHLPTQNIKKSLALLIFSKEKQRQDISLAYQFHAFQRMKDGAYSDVKKLVVLSLEDGIRDFTLMQFYADACSFLGEYQEAAGAYDMAIRFVNKYGLKVYNVDLKMALKKKDCVLNERMWDESSILNKIWLESRALSEPPQIILRDTPVEQ